MKQQQRKDVRSKHEYCTCSAIPRQKGKSEKKKERKIKQSMLYCNYSHL